MVTTTAAARQAKGINLMDLVKLLRHRGGASDISTLTQDDHALLATRVLPTGWYPFESFVRLLVAVHQHVLDGTDNSGLGMGGTSAETMLSGPHAVFLHRGDVLKTLTGFERIWTNYFNFGQVKVTATANGRVLVTICGYMDITPTHALVITGWVARAARLAGGPDSPPRVEHAPFRDGEPFAASIRVEG